MREFLFFLWGAASVVALVSTSRAILLRQERRKMAHIMRRVNAYLRARDEYYAGRG